MISYDVFAAKKNGAFGGIQNDNIQTPKTRLDEFLDYISDKINFVYKLLSDSNSQKVIDLSKNDIEVIDQSMPLKIDEAMVSEAAVPAPLKESDDSFVNSRPESLGESARILEDLAACLLIQDINILCEEGKNRIIEIIKSISIPTDEIKEIIDLASDFMSPINPFSEWGEHDVRETCSLMQSIARVPVHDRKQFIELVSRLFTPEMQKDEQSLLIRTVAPFAPNEHEQLINLASLLLPQINLFHLEAQRFHDCSSRCQIINFISSIHINEREQVVRHTCRLITHDTDGVERLFILRAVANIAANEREARVQRVLDQIPQDLDDGLENRHIDTRIRTLLETPLNQPIPPLHGGMAALAVQGQNGMNVHHGNRDEKTREAILWLQKEQGPLNSEEIRETVAEFNQFLNGLEDSDTKAKALQALSDAGEHEIWPPLLNNNKEHAIDGGRLHISGEELIARLWIFANGHPDKDNCRYAMIKALSDSIEEGRRVCPPGQSQRLVVAVLQGRLDKVDVDGVRLNLNQVVSAFLNENQTCKSREELLKKAEEFLNRDPNLVDREKFLNEIHIYADSMGM
jgi:hypothetical protein